jgi:hypothetical protein
MRPSLVPALLLLCALCGAGLPACCGGSKAAASAPCGVGSGGTPLGEADRVGSTCGTDCECICLEFPKSHAGRRCACGPPRRL